MISKQKSRSVTVGTTRFRHKVSTTPKSKGIYHLNITAQSEDHNGSKLVVEGLIKKDTSVWPLVGGSGKIEYYPIVTRHEAAWCIREAINLGWDYTTSGPNFILQASNEIFRPEFWATERAKNPICQAAADTKTEGE